MTDYRIEHDTMGEVRVPLDALWRAQTQRAVENFPISGSGLEAAQIIALARIKRAAAIVNGELGVLPSEVVDAIVGAADEVIAGEHLDQARGRAGPLGRGHQAPAVAREGAQVEQGALDVAHGRMSGGAITAFVATCGIVASCAAAMSATRFTMGMSISRS